MRRYKGASSDTPIPGQGKGLKKSQENLLSYPPTTIGGALPKHIAPTTLCAKEAVPALRIARQRLAAVRVSCVWIALLLTAEPSLLLRPGRSKRLDWASYT